MGCASHGSSEKQQALTVKLHDAPQLLNVEALVQNLLCAICTKSSAKVTGRITCTMALTPSR
jgi:hypothetical protein